MKAVSEGHVAQTRRPGFFQRVAAWLPKGGALSEEEWERRHRAISMLLVAHAIGILIFGFVRGFGGLHLVSEAGVPLVAAFLANLKGVPRVQKAIIATFGLVACSGILVHLSGGTIEAHFHFFIMIAVISLYQEWQTFLTAILFVALHHGTIGVVDADAVYNHPSAVADPWTWALIHAVLVLGESVALVVSWRLSENAHFRAAESGMRLVEQEKKRLAENIEAQAAVMRRDAQLEEAQQIARLGSFDWNLETNIVEGSDELRRIFGLDFIGPPPSFDRYMESIHPEDRPNVDAVIEKAIETREPYNLDYRIVHPDGSVRFVSSSGKVIQDEDEAKRLVGTVQDVTARRVLENQLAQAQKMEAVGQLAGGVAHDFNNLLSIVTNYGRFAAKELADDHPASADIQEVIKAGERGAKLTRQLLAFSRKDVVRPTTVDINEVVAETQRFLSRTIQENIILSTKLASRLWKTEIDPGEIEQVLMNLVLNAKDAMPTGGDLIIETSNATMTDGQCKKKQGLEPGNYVRLQVSDTGLGMSKAVQQRIFEPFFTTKSLGEGTGLGLASVYGIVARAGGSISVYSEEGMGTTIQIHLPMSTKSDEPEEAAQGMTEPPMGRGETILVVEDEEAVLALTSRILKQSGFEVLEAQSGDEALSLVSNHAQPIHLLVTDVVMPGMSGRELSDQLGVPTLYMSGYTNELIAKQGILAEDEVLIQKPFAPEELTAAVRDVLQRTVGSQRA